eukprot:751649-Hanusia_phi.AAC.1
MVRYFSLVNPTRHESPCSVLYNRPLNTSSTAQHGWDTFRARPAGKSEDSRSCAPTGLTEVALRCSSHRRGSSDIELSRPVHSRPKTVDENEPPVRKVTRGTPLPPELQLCLSPGTPLPCLF